MIQPGSQRSNNMIQPGSQRSNNMIQPGSQRSNNMIQPGSQRSNNMNTPTPQRSNNELSHSKPSNNMNTPTPQRSNNMIQPDSKSPHTYLTEKLARYIGPIKNSYRDLNRFEQDGQVYIVRNDASEYPGYDVPTDLKRFYIFEKFPFINLKTLTYRPYNARMYTKDHTSDWEPFNNNDRALADTLIDFMNMQELPIRIKLGKTLTELFHDSRKKTTIYYPTFTYTTAEDKHVMNHIFYGFNIIRFIENNRDKVDLLHFFLKAMSFVRMKLYKGNLHYKGFVLKSTNRGNNRDSRKSYDGKKLKFQGMINCCILDDNKCTNEEPGRFFGTRKKENPTLCTYASSPLNKPVTRTISSGGRRHTQHKRKTRRTRR
jgi:hypothetical protein